MSRQASACRPDFRKKATLSAASWPVGASTSIRQSWDGASKLLIMRCARGRSSRGIHQVVRYAFQYAVEILQSFPNMNAVFPYREFPQRALMVPASLFDNRYRLLHRPIGFEKPQQ